MIIEYQKEFEKILKKKFNEKFTVVVNLQENILEENILEDTEIQKDEILKKQILSKFHRFLLKKKDISSNSLAQPKINLQRYVNRIKKSQLALLSKSKEKVEIEKQILEAEKENKIKKKDYLLYTQKFEKSFCYKNIELLKIYLNCFAKIKTRKDTNFTARQHKFLVKLIKKARLASILPFTFQQYLLECEKAIFNSEEVLFEQDIQNILTDTSR